MVLPDVGAPGTSREIYSEDADDGTHLDQWLEHSVYRQGVASSSLTILTVNFSTGTRSSCVQ